MRQKRVSQGIIIFFFFNLKKTNILVGVIFIFLGCTYTLSLEKQKNENKSKILTI